MDFIKHDQEEAAQAFLPKTREDDSISEKLLEKEGLTSKWSWRIGLEIFMSFVIVALLARPLLDDMKVKPSPVPSFPLKAYTFIENPRYLHGDMFASREETLHTLHNWIELSADGRGYVRVNNSDSFDLGEPYEIGSALHLEPVYMMSVFHQLHCLSYIVEHYQTAFDGVNMTQEVAHHSAHCFDYLRQSIICAADTSLEGKTDAGPGWGSKHQCKDYDAVLAWANERTVVKFRGNMPTEAVL